MADEKIIFSMAGVNKIYPPNKQVLKNIYLSFFYGAKIGVLGLNGSGKSSLLRIIAGLDKEFQGEVVSDQTFRVGLLEQEPDLDKTKTVKEIVEEGVKATVDLLKEFEAINEKFADPEIMENPDKMEKLIEKQGAIQEKLDAIGAWELDHKLERAMDALRCPPPDSMVTNLSGGEKRRVALCRLLLQEPDVLLLDEPTTADLDLEKHCIERTLSPRFVLDVDDASVVEGNLPVARFTSVTNTAPARTRFNFARTLLDTARRIIEDVSDDVHSRDAFSILEASIYISRELFHVQLFGWCTYVKNK
jgi:ABC-type Mn2+/Zn2+ transport system ATPase subunit